MNKVRQEAFTLVELMTVLLIVAVLVAVAAPNFKATIDRNSSLAAANEIAGLLQYAKANAAMKSKPVLVCALKGTKDNYKCDVSASQNGSATDFPSNKFAAVIYPKSMDDNVTVLKIVDVSDTLVVRNISGAMMDTSDGKWSGTKGAGMGGVIAFNPDNTSSMHGVPSTFKAFDQDGSLNSTNNKLDLKYENFASSAGNIYWGIRPRSDTADDKYKEGVACYLVKVTAFGKPQVVADEPVDGQTKCDMGAVATNPANPW